MYIYHHIPGSSPSSGNTWFFPRVNLSCLRIEWPTSVGTMDMWWLFWTMPCSLPFGSEITISNRYAFCYINAQKLSIIFISAIKLAIIHLITSLSDSNRIWSYSDNATKKMIEVTFSKQWIHFRRSERWPPTSTIL